MALTADLIRGHTETIILAQLMMRDSYGYQINKVIQEITNDQYELKEATLYSAFRRLENAGFIESYWGDENIGARRKYYKITELGRVLYRRNLKDWNESQIIINSLIKLGEDIYE